MARRQRSTRRLTKGGARKGPARRLSVKSLTVEVEPNRQLSSYVMKIPRGMRDRSPREVIQKLYDQIKSIHGGGKGDFRKQHFYFTFSGTEYDFATGQRIGRATYGTFLSKSLHQAREDLVSRIKAIQEGAAHGKKTIKGIRSGGSAFRNGPDVIEARVAEQVSRKGKDGRSWQKSRGSRTSRTNRPSRSSTKRGSSSRGRGSANSGRRKGTRS